MFQDLIQDTTLHLVVMSPIFLLAMTVSHTVLVFDVLESFEECCSGVLQNISQLGLIFSS